jgi:hypothetical protein
MGMSAEQKAAASNRMKALHASGKLLRKKLADVNDDNDRKIKIAQVKASIERTSTWSIVVSVNWEHLPILEAQQAYAMLKKEFERAGFIINQRSMPEPGSYTCFMCKNTHLGEPRGKDYSYTNPKTGLMEVVEICGEACWLAYQGLRIRERKEREMPAQHA